MILPGTDPAVHAMLSAVGNEQPRYRIVPEVAITTPSGGSSIEFQDLTNYLLAYSVGNSLNDAVGSGLFTFARSKNTDSLSPLVQASTHRFGDGRPVLDPTCEVNLNITIESPPGTAVGFLRRFTGRIDRVNVAASGTRISVQCRDGGGKYLNRFMTQAASYGTGPIETVMGNVLAGNGFAATDLFVPVSPGFVIDVPFWAGEITVLEALRILAQQIGWDVRWYEHGPHPFTTQGLVFYDPGRTRVIGDCTFSGRNYKEVTELSISDEDVRNDWWGWYPGAVAPVHRFDQTSIDRYGLRSSVIGEAIRSLNISTEAAMGRFLDAALADNKDPFATHEIRRPIFPVVELNDMHDYTPYFSELYNQTMTMAVRGYREDWKAGPGTSWTTIQSGGTPIAAYRDYRKPPPAPPPVIISTAPPTADRYGPEGQIWKVRPTMVPGT